MGKVSESIFSGLTTVIPMADVCYIQRDKRLHLQPNIGVWVVMKSSTYNTDDGDWNNAPYLKDEDARSFIRCWCDYRSELESETLMDLTRTVTDIRGKG